MNLNFIWSYFHVCCLEPLSSIAILFLFLRKHLIYTFILIIQNFFFYFPLTKNQLLRVGLISHWIFYNVGSRKKIQWKYAYNYLDMYWLKDAPGSFVSPFPPNTTGFRKINVSISSKILSMEFMNFKLLRASKKITKGFIILIYNISYHS